MPEIPRRSQGEGTPLGAGDLPSIELSRVGPGGVRVPSLSELTSDLQSMCLSLRISSSLGEPDEVRQKIHRLFDRFDKQATSHGYHRQEIDDSRFAIVALLDETVFNSDWQGKESWRAMSLQQEIYKINVAGEEFFTRLDKLRANVKENRRTLEVYFDCLALGFEGRFKLFGREKLDAVIGEFSKELAKGREWSMAKLSPNWNRPDEFSEAVGEGIPMWLTLVLFIPGALILVLVFFLLARGAADSTAETMRQLLERLGG